jgi:phenylalanyl-tRNA synthetase beta chain
MVVVEYTYDEMKRLVDLPRDQMVASLSEMGAPSEYMADTKKIISELTPNRPDWYSMEGLARALKAYHNKKLPSYKVEKSDYVVKVDKSVEAVRPYSVCAVVKSLSFDDQRIKDMVLLQEKLIATLGRKVKKFGLGIYPLGEIAFPIIYTTRKPEEIRYCPLGYEKEMDANEILAGHKKGLEHGHILKGKERYPIFVDAEERIMALVPIVNSAKTGKVNEQTKEIFIEVTGTDMGVCKTALNILVCTFADMGGVVYEVKMQYPKEKFATPNLTPKKMKLDLKKINKVLGIELREKDVVRYLRKMGYGYVKGYVAVPPYRADILGLIDIIEDIAIAYGYNNFIPTIPNFFTPGGRNIKWDSVDETMRGMGFVELKTFILTNKERLMGVGVEDEVVEIANPNNVEYTVVRPNLIVDMMEVFVVNKMKPLPQKFYEIGEVHQKTTKKRLIFGVMDNEVKFEEMKGYLQTLVEECGFEFELVRKESKTFQSNVSCVVKINKKEIGVFGKVKKEILDKMGIGFEVYVCELEI